MKSVYNRLTAYGLRLNYALITTDNNSFASGDQERSFFCALVSEEAGA